MTKSAQRSAMWPPSTRQSALVERPSPGTQKPVAGAVVSIAAAAAHSAMRHGPVANAPAIQNGADDTCQMLMRRKLRWLAGSWRCSAHSMNTQRPICKQT